jgi:repressor LexA
MDQLTPRQREILDFLIRRTREAGAPPTRAEIALAFGFRSPNAAEEHLRALARHGVIEILPGRSRGLRLLIDVGANDGGRRLPVIGRVAAGRPILALEHVEAEVAVDPGLFLPRADYLLRVRGDSMTGVGILEGDWLAVHRAATADTGQIVVARLGEEVTVKRLSRAAGGLRLLAENPAYAPIEIDPEATDFTIEGIAVGLIRRW